MRYNEFAKTEIKISQLGFGCWGIGQDLWKGTNDQEAKRTLLKAIESGVNFFDSALVYGRGHSEQLVGEVERESREKLFITSKIPSKLMQWPAKDDALLKDSFPVEHIIRKTEQSLQNLKRDYIDLQQFHVWNDKWAEQDEWKEAVLKLKEQGKVRFFGISINDHEPENGIEAGKSGLIDSFQVIFNIFDQSPADTLFPFCQENNISVIARVPYDEGGLTGMITPQTQFPPKDWRNRYFRDDRKNQVWKRVQNLQQEIKSECDSVVEAALRYVISFDAVTTVIPGMRKEKNLLDNITNISKGGLSDSLLEKIKAHRWERNFYS